MIKNKYLYISAGILCLFYFSSVQVLYVYGEVFDALSEITMLGMGGFMMPVLSSLPGALEFYEEKRSLNYRYKVMREGRWRYTLRTTARGMLSGGLVVALALFVFFGVVIVIGAVQGYAPNFAYGGNIYGDEQDYTIYFSLFREGKGWLVMMLNFAMMIMHGMVWPCFSIAAGAFISNRKFAIAFPFLLFRLFAYIYDLNEYLTPIPFDMTLGIIYEPAGGFLRVMIYLLAVLVICLASLNANLYCIYKWGD